MFSLRKKCPDNISDLAELYLLDRLSDAENCGLEEHLLSCSRCMDIFEEAEQFLIAFRDAKGRIKPKTAAAFTDGRPRTRWSILQPFA